MPKQAAAGGGQYLGTAGWLKLASENAVVLMHRLRQGDDFPGDNGPVPTVDVDVLIVAPAARSGEFWPNQNIYNSAITSKLLDEPDRTAVGASIKQGKRGSNKYPQANPTSEPEWGLIEKVYADHGVSLDAVDADEQLFRSLRKANTDARNRDVAAATAATATTKGGTGVGDDDEPPF